MASTKRVQSYRIDLVPDEDGGFTVVAPALPRCVSYGETVQTATKNAREAIGLHLENLTAHRQCTAG